MRRLLIFLMLGLVFGSAFSANKIKYTIPTTGADGKKIYKGNVAVIVRNKVYSFRNFKQESYSEITEDINGSTNALYTKLLIDNGFNVVNRDAKVNKTVCDFLKQCKSEDYIKGFTTQAKNIGADFILLIDNIIKTEDGPFCSNSYDYRMISVASNYGNHYHTEYFVYYDNQANFEKTIHQQRLEQQDAFASFLQTISPSIFVAKGEGRNVSLTPATTVGSIYENKNVYVYDISEAKNTILMNEPFEYRTWTELGKIKTNSIQIKNGSIMGKSDKEVKSTENTFAFLDNSQPRINCGLKQLNVGTQILVTYKPLEVDNSSYESFVKQDINNKLASSLSSFKNVALIEYELSDEISKERKLQKTEDFLKGYTVEQMKAFGAEYFVYVKNLKIDKDNQREVSFTMDIIDLTTNSIIKSNTVDCNVSQIEPSIRYYLSHSFTHPCTIVSHNEKEISIVTDAAVGSQPKDEIVLDIRESSKDLNGKTLIQKKIIAKCLYKEWKGNEHVLQIDKILYKEGFDKAISDPKCTIWFMMPDKEPDFKKKGEIEKSMKAAKRAAVMRAIGNSVNVSVGGTQQNGNGSGNVRTPDGQPASRGGGRTIYSNQRR